MIKQRVTAQKRKKIFLCFKNDLKATQTAEICGVNRNTVNRYYNLLRRAILSESIREEGAREARARGGGQDAGVRVSQARGEGVRDGRAELLEVVADVGHQGG